MICPVCGAEQPLAASCQNCGVIFERIRGQKRSETLGEMPESEVEKPPVLPSSSLKTPATTASKTRGFKGTPNFRAGALETNPEEERLWDAIVEAPQDRKRHQDYLGYCLRNAALPLAVRRYNQIIQDYGQDPVLLHFQSQIISILQFGQMGLDRNRRMPQKKDASQALGCMAFVVSVFLILIGTIIKDPALKIFRYIGFGVLFCTFGFFLYRFILQAQKLKKKSRL